MLNSLVNNARKYFNPQLINFEMTKKENILLHFVPSNLSHIKKSITVLSFCFSPFKVLTYEKKELF